MLLTGALLGVAILVRFSVTNVEQKNVGSLLSTHFICATFACLVHDVTDLHC